LKSKSSPSRRDFLKLTGLVPLSVALPPFVRLFDRSQAAQGDRKNVLVIVFDAFSAYNISLYGYARETTPNLARLAQRAIVYHNHFAGSNFTTPGTASLLTGTLPWTHRAFQLNGTVTEAFANKNIFQAFQHYYRIVYSHNPLVNTLFKQFAQNLDDYVPQDRLFLTADALVHGLLGNDEDIADVAWTRAIKKEPDGYSYSLFLSNLYERYIHERIASVKPLFPRGIPSIRGDNYFLLEDAIDWLKRQIGQLPQPYLGYFHFMPPHAPTATRRDFYGAFAKDNFEPPQKPQDVFSSRLLPPELLRQRTSYDEYILYVDQEFGRLFDYLESSGVLDNTWVVLTADHGELFERGVRGHISPLLYQPVVRIPLLIFEPGSTARVDIRSSTSAVDLLPTLLHLTGEDPASWAEGTILPPFAPAAPDPDRSVYALHAKRNLPEAPLTHATAMLVKGNHKLTYFFGYEELGDGVERVELYDIKADPQELNNLYAKDPATSAALLAALKEKLKEVNQPYL
jgi:arylsulfatase A-like enzyme